MTVERIAIRSGATESVAWVGPGVLDDPRRFLVSPSGRWLLVSSRNAAAVAGRIRDALSPGTILDFAMDESEETKTLDAVRRITDRAIEAGVRRDDAFVAVGGGVVTDVVGFAAAIVLRGIAWNAVPTTVAGMADAAIGGKTGVDHPLGKNLIGAFHSPRAILVDPSAAATLSDRDYRSGLVEAFKGAWIADAVLSERAESRLPDILARDADALSELVAGAVRVKAQIVSSDPFEHGPRRILNFGHTLGHAFEAAGGYRALRHGEAVAWGIAAALAISRERAGLSSGEQERLRAVLARLGPFPEPERHRETLAPLLARDKKATSLGLAGVVLEAIGRARVDETIPLDAWLDAAERVRIA
ncbi:MAG TPA: 3-dehydroquinate synthase family protein [Thermoanaerobaculia bacterium]|nr:3-dehydroquinate synthase family protein [Thermoanaerobaculia bacterium]